jgi:hypothetical protein
VSKLILEKFCFVFGFKIQKFLKRIVRKSHFLSGLCLNHDLRLTFINRLTRAVDKIKLLLEFFAYLGFAGSRINYGYESI